MSTTHDHGSTGDKRVDNQTDIESYRRKWRAKARSTRLTNADLLWLLDIPEPEAHGGNALDSDAGVTAVTHPDTGILLLAIGSKVHCDDGDAEITCLDDTEVTIQLAQTGHIRTCAISDLVFQAQFYVIE